MNPEQFEPRVDPGIWQRFPSYRALSVIVRGFVPVPSSQSSNSPPAIVQPPWCDSSIEAWHQVFRQFGANPKRSPPSFDGLVRRFRKDGALPKISPVVDCYNALSIEFATPFGGEDIDRYSGSPHLTVADGSEPFDTVQNSAVVEEHPDPGEIIWRDDQGVTCRRWNWRQCKRTAITEASTNLWFVIDRLPPLSVEDLERAGNRLLAHLQIMAPQISGTVSMLTP